MKNPVEISIRMGRETSIIVDGIDLTDKVDFVNIHRDDTSSLPMVSLGIRAEVTFDGMSDPNYLRKGLEMEESFQLLDPARVEAEALEMELPGSNPVTRAIMQIMKRELGGSES